MLKKGFVTSLALALLCVACAPKYTPLEQAVIDHVQAQVGPESRLSLRQISLADSLTYGQLLQQRIKAFEVKYKQDEKFLATAVAKNNRGKIDRFDDAMKKDVYILDALRKMDLGGLADAVVCYDMVFSGKAERDDVTTVFDAYYAAVSPDGKVLSLQPGQKGLHKGFGKFLPGYQDILKDAGYNALSGEEEAED